MIGFAEVPVIPILIAHVCQTILKTHHQHSSTIKYEQTGQTMHEQWQEIPHFLTYRSVRQYECSQRLEFIITVLHFWFRGSWMCYTCIIAFTGSLVGSEIIYSWLDPVIQSSNPVQRLETAKNLLLFSLLYPHMEAHHGNNVSNFRYVLYNWSVF